MVGLFADPIFYKIGTENFLFSFFSTVAHNLEQREWGSRFPCLMNELYSGSVNNNGISKLKTELTVIREELKQFSPDKIIWDFDDLNASPPWGNGIADTITDLSNYFWTSDGKDLFDVLFEAIDAAVEIDENLIIKEL